MLEGLAAWVLKYFLGKYVENLNTDQLSIGILQGEVELENLPLKKEALRQVGLPIQVTAGFIGKVKLQVPFRQLRSAPWIIKIERLYLVAAPVNLAEWDDEAEEQAQLERKLSSLDALEVQWRSSTECVDQSFYASSYMSWMSIGTSVMSNIVENVQLSISDVHIRYEDNITIDHKYFCFGIVIDSLVAQSCNEEWESGFASGPISYKVLELNKLSVYWDDCEGDDDLSSKPPPEFTEAMGSSSTRGKQFIINAISGRAHLQKNRSTEPLRSKTTPRLVCDVMFDDFPINITDKQYTQLNCWQRGLSIIQRRIANRSIRPTCSVVKDPQAWWMYAKRASIGSQKPRIIHWEQLVERARRNVAYVKLYEKLLLNPAVVLTEEEKKLKDQVDTELDLEELRTLRLAAMHRAQAGIPKFSPKDGVSTNYLSTWFPQFWFSEAARVSCDINDINEEKRISEELYEALESTMDDATYLKRDVIFGQFNFSLKSGTINLLTYDELQHKVKSVMELQLEKVVVGFESRPRHSSYKFTLTLGAMFLKDRLTDDTVFPVLVAPQGRDSAPSTIDAKRHLPPSLARYLNTPCKTEESLFQLTFEMQPFSSSIDCRLHVRTQSLDIVYNPEAFCWLADFFTKPQQAFDSNLRLAARRKYHAIKIATKQELIKNWEKILSGDLSNRKTWDVDLDISAPQIIFVEHFCDKNAIIVVLDLGRLHFSNQVDQKIVDANEKRESDEEEAFETPCSTPPGSEASPEGPPLGLPLSQLNELSLHHMLYDRYVVELGDMQVLVGRVRDNWKYAQLKGASSLHVLDRFNISMQIERRIVHTTDPQFPSLTFSGNLPRLIVHVNEQKISALKAMAAIVTDPGIPSPFRTSGENTSLSEDLQEAELPDDSFKEDVSAKELSRLVIMQFTVQHLALEVQSRNRSVAELQVSGVRATLTQRPFDTSVTLTVHSLLLVDAMQTFGRDFELLVASHKHVGMDSVSGSLRDSEPTSPTSPGSPEPGNHPASPVAISQALSSLEAVGRAVSPPVTYPATSPRSLCSPPILTSPPPHPPIIRAMSPEQPDAEALITVELTFISGACPGHDGQPLQIAAVQFNNLDIIANQETIVELLGFARRVFPPAKAVPRPPPMESEASVTKSESEVAGSQSEEGTMHSQMPARIELTFDFHRLNVLLLRAVVKGGSSVGRKICTATMMQAKIKATLGQELVVEGSLGGIQVVDLTPEGQRHQRILSLGSDPLTTSDPIAELSAGLYGFKPLDTCEAYENPAFSFILRRSLQCTARDSDKVDIKVRLASVWYTHSPNLLRELQSCATEFKQYMSNLARTIKSAATEVAMGFVHSRAEALALSLYMSNRFSSSLYGGSNPDVASPRKRRRSFSQSQENVASTYTLYTPFTPHTPRSPGEEECFDPTLFNLDVVLDTPVIVLPRSPTSDHVFVAHLGKITLKNSYPEVETPWEKWVEKYHVDIRDMNLFAVEAMLGSAALHLSAGGDTILPKPEKMYSCSGGKAILHDTVIEIAIERHLWWNPPSGGSLDFDFDSSTDYLQRIKLSGGVVGPLKVSLSRGQYEQVLQTSKYLLTSLTPPSERETLSLRQPLGDIEEETDNASNSKSKFHIDPAVRARTTFARATSPKSPLKDADSIAVTVAFELPEFTVELLGEWGVPDERALVSISFRDFLLHFDRPSTSSSHLQMSLKSLVMEDLLVPPSNKNRFLVISSAAPTPYNRRVALSQSCPSLSSGPLLIPEHNSLPDKLSSSMYCQPRQGRYKETKSNLFRGHTSTVDPPCTPPPSPRPGLGLTTTLSREDNLVLINIDTVQRHQPQGATSANQLDRTISIYFNCLDVIANIESWVVVFDFFAVENRVEHESLSVSYQMDSQLGHLENNQMEENVTSKMDLQVRSLTVVLVRPEYEVAKANISHLTVKTYSAAATNYDLEGRLGSMSLCDLTPHGKLYRERFLTSGKEALHVQYHRYDSGSEKHESCDSELRIEMSSVVYVHTQRFLNEIYAYFHRFSQLQTLMASMRTSDSAKYQMRPSSRLLISIDAGSPVLILPVASTCPDVLVADLGQLTVRNGFRRAGSEGTIATSAPEGTTTVSCLLDVMSVDLMNMDLFVGRRVLSSSDGDFLQFGNILVVRDGPSLLPDKCHLKLQVDRNLDTHLTREVPDLSIQGTLTKLEAFLDLAQYKLIRGLLAFNIGENLQDLAYNSPESSNLLLPQPDINDPVWLTMSIHLDLVNVLVHLREKHGEGASLACINFIKSRLVVESFSDKAQDIDLVSAEILLTDTRYLNEPMNKRYNIFTNILQPLGLKSRSRSSSSYKLSGDRAKMEKKPSQDSEDGTVQAEIHHRKRKDYSKATILLHNMRVMAVLDWWETIRDFITQNFELPSEATTAFSGTSVSPIPHAGPKKEFHPNLRVANKYPAVIDAESIPFEFKLNVTDSEIVLLEDTSIWDTNAIILKSTTVISYRPGLLEKPLSCNLNHCEVFSCLLGMEDETALSIIDPVTVNMEVALRAPLSAVRGISDAVVTSEDRALEVSMQALTVRLSYHDFRMLARMLESVPQQTKRARDRAIQKTSQPANVRNQILKLAALGFSEEDCGSALERCNGQLDDAALWLTQNVVHTVQGPARSDTTSPVSFDTVEVKLGCLSIVVIDDCRDADVPLLELSLAQLFFKQILGDVGTAKFHLTSDYYNRVLSGWEPFIESWRCNMKWERTLTSGLTKNRVQLEVFSEDLMNVNITSTLMELYSTVKASWSEDYWAEDKTGGGVLNLRRRSPFVPFAIKNDTGCQLWFTTLIKTADNISETPTRMCEESWVSVAPDETIPFTFEGREKTRHRDTHKVQVHQIMVRVGVWGAVSPVSVDKVGVFYRDAPPQPDLCQIDIPSARVVFAISLEGTARKLVTVRSALTINNNLSETVEAKLESTVPYPDVWTHTICLQIPAGGSLPVPLSHAQANIWIRPLDGVKMSPYHAFSTIPLGWMKVNTPGELIYESHQCQSNRDNCYRFVAAIYHENYPTTFSRSPWQQPGHIVTLYSPVLVTNLLPCDLHYSVRQAPVRGYIKPGMSANIHELDYEQRIEINLQIDGFPRHGTLTLSGSTTSYTAEVRLHDEEGSRLILNASVAMLQGAGLRVSVSAPFWFVNKTSLPLVVRQEGSSQKAAGQGAVNEVARIVTPLLFSFADQDGGPLAQVRIGNGHLVDSAPQWCQPFALQTGSNVLRLKVDQRDRADVIFTVGIHIREGRGRHRNTKIITLSPRFQLHNKSSFHLQFAQLCLATKLNDPLATATYGKAVQDCSLAWHWPEADRDHLLCVRLVEVKQCQWSGGFAIDNDDSFHINIRDINNKMHFLRVEIVLQDATYFTVFTDAETMPPPVRIDNCAQVPITFYQADAKIETPRGVVRAQSSVQYAWDQPQGSSQITVMAPGGCSATYDVNDISREENNVPLSYENFIYIAFTATFNHVDERRSTFEDLESQQLVLDCLDGYHVVLNRKQQGARSQLWRMSSEGQLQHEGSGPPRDPKSKSSYSSEKSLVLDIAGPAPQPMQCVPLVLRRPESRRASTQTWRFTETGRLCCAHNNMCVQAKDGFFGTRQGSEAVLGPAHDGHARGGGGQIPLEQAVSRMKMRPGSGCLYVSVFSDGPTRVLCVRDPVDSKGQVKEWSASLNNEDTTTDQGELDLKLRLSGGLGISIVSRKPPEELLFIHLKGIILHAARTSTETTFDCSIGDLQCDNQLFEPEYPVVLYFTKSYREDEPKRKLPAVNISARKQHSLNANAHIFEHLMVSVKTLSLCIEELLLLKLIAMFGWLNESETEDAEENDFETQRRVIEATSAHADRYYFGFLNLTPDQIRLSVATSPKLSPQLQQIKKKLGLRLIKFEDAAVDLKEFKKRHPFETSQCLLSSVVKHFKSELRWQAAVILGTVDFLGNPLGLINDVSEGVSGLISEGSVGTLVKSVTHGLSNSAAKFTETLSDGLGRAILDELHEEGRQRIRRGHSGSSRDHLWAGVKGLSFGLVGGVTSIFRQTYEGSVQEGFQGFISGIGKGLVGTVTKPMVGILDLASETASAVRDSSRSSDRPCRFRLARVVLGPGGLMPPFSSKQAQGQEFLYNINNRNYSETLVSYEILLCENEGLRILISSENILLFSSTAAPVVQYQLSNLIHSQAVSMDDATRENLLHYVQLELEPSKKKPLIRCDSREIAERVAQQINYAQSLFQEIRYTISTTPDAFS